MRLLRRLWKDDDGAISTEYIILVGLLAIGLIAVITIFRDKIGELFRKFTGELDTRATTEASTIR